MKTFLLYSLEVNLLLCFFYSIYRFFFRSDQSFIIHRFYLLSSALISLIIPLITFPTATSIVAANTILKEASIFIASLSNHSASAISYNYWNIIFTVYLLGAGFSMLLFLYHLYIIIRQLYKGRKKKRNGYTTVKVKEKIPAFSFFRYLVTPEDVYRKEIIYHELVHIRQLHSLDVFLFKFITIVFWYNPLLYFYSTSIKENHEFLADIAVIRKSKNVSAYIELMLSYTFQTDVPLLAGNFVQHSFLKRRIRMLMEKKQNSSSRRTFIKYLTCAPLLLIVVFSLSGFKEKLMQPVALPVTAEIATDAEFKGGMNNMYTYIAKSFRYPSNDHKGIVFVQFDINKKGEIEQPKIVKKLDDYVDAEVIRLVKGMPEWTPAKRNGKPFRSTFTLPIRIG